MVPGSHVTEFSIQARNFKSTFVPPLYKRKCADTASIVKCGPACWLVGVASIDPLPVQFYNFDTR